MSKKWRRKQWDNVKRSGRHVNSFVKVTLFLDIMDKEILCRYLKENTHILGDYMKFSSMGKVFTKHFLENYREWCQKQEVTFSSEYEVK